MSSTILLVDDHPVFRQGLRQLLEKEKDLKVVGEAGDGMEAIDRLRELSPDIVVMDINMPLRDGIETTRLGALSESGQPRGSQNDRQGHRSMDRRSSHFSLKTPNRRRQKSHSTDSASALRICPLVNNSPKTCGPRFGR